MAVIVAGTGHRPEDCESEEVVRRRVRESLGSIRADCVIGGMAAGYDLWFADEAINLGIEVWAAKPWINHGPRQVDASLYADILAKASRIVNVVEREEYPGPWCYHARNEWMVDNATHVLAYWNPSKKSGGTFACVNYAKKKSRPIRNIYGPPF